LTVLALDENLISDISSLLGLTQLVFLGLTGNIDIPCNALEVLKDALANTLIDQPVACMP
jgi:hypothetical protein